MRIVSLEPYLTDSLVHFGLAPQLVGISRRCVGDPTLSHATVISAPKHDASAPAVHMISDALSVDRILVDQVRALNPTHVFIGLPLPDRAEFDLVGSVATKSLLAEARAAFASTGSEGPQVYAYAPTTLTQVFDTLYQLGKDLGLKQAGHDLAQRMKAQLMDWGDNFYDRMKNKRVTFLASVQPLRIAGRWIPDMINIASCVSQEPVPGGPHRQVTWEEILAFKPDVLLVAPEGLAHQEALSTFKQLEKIPNWEKAPAVKRGEVFFCEGDRLFYRPGPSLLDGMGVLVSAIAGIESGYITKRDSFVRLRFLEMQRHRF